MYQLIPESSTDKRRLYRSSISETEISTSIIYTDGSGNNWWAFDDLLQIPFIRKKAAEKLTQLYGAGVTIEDLRSFIAKHKETLKGNDPDKYERAFTETFNLESIIESVADPIKQSLSLCSVYILADNERVDTFSFVEATTKMNQWALDLDSQAFFLNWLTDGMNNFTKHLQTISQIASNQTR